MSAPLAVLDLARHNASPAQEALMLSLLPYEPFRIPPSSGATAGQVLEPTWDSNRAVREGLKACAILASVIGGICEQAASVPWYWWRVSKSGREEMTEPVEFIERPRLDGKVDSFSMMELAHHYLYLSGNALFGIKWEGGSRFQIRPAELHLENPHGCAPVIDREKLISGYQWDDSAIGGWRYWDSESILHVFGRPDPAKPYYWGWSIIEALAMTIDSEREARRLNLLRLRRNGSPGTIITDENLAPKDRKTTEDELNARADRYFGAFMVLAGKQQIAKQSFLKEDELGLLKGLAFYRDDIVTAFGLHPAMFSSEAATYDNMEQGIKLRWRVAVVRNSRFSRAFTSRFVRKSEFGRLFIAPDYSEVEELKDLSTKIDQTEKLVDKCRIAVNDAIATTGLPVPAQAGGHVALVNGTLIPMSDAAENLED